MRVPRPRPLAPAVERVLSRPRPKLRGWSHRIAFFVSIPCGVALVVAAAGAREIIAALAFALGTSLMFGASALVHWKTWTSGQYHTLFNLDFTGIFCCVGGTASGLGLVVLDGRARAGLVAGTLILAAAGVAFVWMPRHPPRGLMNTLYLLVGWYPILYIVPLWRGLGSGGFTLMMIGGACYTVGAVIVGAQRPDPWPLHFGYHEIFHALVIAAVACHYTLMVREVVRVR